MEDILDDLEELRTRIGLISQHITTLESDIMDISAKVRAANQPEIQELVPDEPPEAA